MNNATDYRPLDGAELRDVNNSAAAAEFAPLAFAKPTRRDSLIASGTVGLSLLIFVVLVPFARTRLEAVPAFIGVYQAALIVSDLITAAYLYGQFRASNLRPLFLLASGYLFTAIVAFIHLLTFPGLFADAGLLGAGPQTTAWLYMAWHAVFPLFVMAYALARSRPPSARELMAWLTTVVTLVAAVAVISTAGHQLLPEIMQGNRYAPAYMSVVAGVWLSSAFALLVLWRKRERTVLDLWLMVVMCAWLCDIALAAVFNAGRYDLGFYAGRLYGLLAATFVLCVLLLETTSLQARVAALVADAAAAREHRRAQEALNATAAQLQESQRRLDAVLNNASVAIFLMDDRQQCVYMNAAAEQLTGFTLQETQGRPLHDVLHHTRPDGTPYPLNECPIDRAFPQNNKEQGEEVFVHKNGTFYPVAFTASPIRDQAAKVVGTIIEVRDVGEEKRVREELKASEARLREADRRKDEFLATLAHELRNPLAPIRNGLEVLKRATGKPELQRQTREIMERQLTHMVRLVDDLLDVSRISRGRIELRKEAVDLRSVVNDAAESTKPSMEAGGHEITIRLGDSPLVVCGDRTRLAQVVANLLSNAVKYTPRGGRIDVSLEEQDEHGVIRVVDTGIGIHADQLTDIFDLFAQVDKSSTQTQTGLGIGLALVKQLVELHGGTISVASQGLGKGSTFIVRLPLVNSGIVLSEVRPRPSTPEAIAPRRILIADDNVDAATSLRQVLELAGHNVQLAHDGVDACVRAETYRPDVILMDLGMPRLDGYGACRALREKPWGRDVLIVALTGWGQEEDRRKTKEAGFDAHLVKPARYEAVAALLSGSRVEKQVVPSSTQLP